MCKGCPFNFFSEESERIQNYGCLPTPYEILQLHAETGKNWACHEHPNKTCTGLRWFAKEYPDKLKAPYNPSAPLLLEEGIHLPIQQ